MHTMQHCKSPHIIIGRDTKMALLELEARLDNLLSTAQVETADIDLFAPLKEREECPICMIPLPFGEREIIFMVCCGKRICMGCVNKQKMTDTKNKVPMHKMKCAFCCQQEPKNQVKALKKLIKKNNPDALMQMGVRYALGDETMQSNTKSLEMVIRAAELGHAPAYAIIGDYYRDGIAVEEDFSKAAAFWEIAAKKGSIYAHHQVAVFHQINGNVNKAIDHLKVTASVGDQESMDKLMKMYKENVLSKDELTQTLRAFQNSNNGMKSKDRDEARATIIRE